jgi:hypothetical protein
MEHGFLDNRQIIVHCSLSLLRRCAPRNDVHCSLIKGCRFVSSSILYHLLYASDPFLTKIRKTTTINKLD